MLILALFIIIIILHEFFSTLILFSLFFSDQKLSIHVQLARLKNNSFDGCQPTGTQSEIYSWL